MEYKVFISYKHSPQSRAFAESIEESLKAYGKPLLSRPMSVFRDEHVLSPGKELGQAIREGLLESEYLIYLASYEAAVAPWIADEIKIWFEELKRNDKFIIVVIEGQIFFKGTGSAEEIDWDKTKILPPNLAGYDIKNPLFINFSWAQKDTDRSLDNPDFKKEINLLSARINNIAPGEMTDKAVLQYKKNRRLRNFAIAALSALLLLASVLAVISYLQREKAIRNKSGALSFLSLSTLQNNPTLAFCIAKEALNLNKENPDAATAIRSAYYNQPFYNTYTGHTGPINDLVFSPDGRCFVTCADDYSIIIRSLDGKIIKTLMMHGELPLHLAYSPNGKYLSVGGNAGKVLVYTMDGVVVDSFAHDDKIERLQFSPDNKLLLTASRDSTAALWNLEKHSHITLPHDQRVYAACFSPDGHFVLTCGGNEYAYIWDTAGHKIKELKRHDGPVVNGIYSHNGRFILTTGFDNKVMLWDSTGNFIKEFANARNVSPVLAFSPDDQRFVFAGWGHLLYVSGIDGTLLDSIPQDDEIVSAEFARGGDYFATGGNDSRVHIYTNQGKPLATLKGQGGHIQKIAFSPDGRYLLSAGDEGNVLIWDFRKSTENIFPRSNQEVTALDISPDGEEILTGDSRGSIALCDKNGRLKWSRKLHNSVTHKVLFSANGQYIVTADMDHTGMLMSLKDTAKTYVLQHSDDVVDADISPANNYVITAGYDSVSRIWDMQGHLMHTLADQQDRILCARFSPDGNYLVTTSRNRTAAIRDMTGKLLKLLPLSGPGVSLSFSSEGDKFITCCRNAMLTVWSSHGDSLLTLHCPDGQIIYQARFSPDGKYIAATTTANIVIIWDAKGKYQTTLTGHQNMIVDIDFSKTGKYLVSASMDNSLRLWTVTGDLLQIFNGHNNIVKSARFTPDGSRIVSISYDSTMRIWPLEPQQIIDSVQSRYPYGIYSLSEQERKRYGVE